MTFLWCIVWLTCNLIGSPEPLLFAPVNGWVGTLLFAVAMDLAAAHAYKR